VQEFGEELLTFGDSQVHLMRKAAVADLTGYLGSDLLVASRKKV
jgi:hypothetical protein